MQEMVKQGILIPYIVPSFAHTESDVERTVEASRRAFKVYARALEDGWQRHLEGPPVKPVFRPFN
jgi:glutamate-1-semialdehyde 2,1-aminomutase